MERSATTLPPLDHPDTQYHRVALLVEQPAQVAELGAPLRQLALQGVREVYVWLCVERFKAPSGTHPPYRSLARQEAREITAQRVAGAEASAALSVPSLSGPGRETRVESVLDPTPEAIAARLLASKVDLLISAGESGSGLGVKAASLAGCALLIVNEDASGHPLRPEGTTRAGRLLRALHI
jgi:hypothetical protein